MTGVPTPDTRRIKSLPSGKGIPNTSEWRRPVILRPHYIDGEDIWVVQLSPEDQQRAVLLNVDWPERSVGRGPAFLTRDEAARFTDKAEAALNADAATREHEEALKMNALHDSEKGKA